MIRIEVHDSRQDWIGVDLNSNGHIAVLAHPASGEVVKLGKNVHQIHAKYEKLRKKWEKKKEPRKVRKIETRKQCILDDMVTKVSRQIVGHARALRCGIKLERISGAAGSSQPLSGDAFGNIWAARSFQRLQYQVEKRARKEGVPVAYIDPAFTSQTCWMCGNRGRRKKKKFECPHCGHSTHADVNAAFNIADAPVKLEPGRKKPEGVRFQSAFYREIFRDQKSPAGQNSAGLMDAAGMEFRHNILAILEME